MHSKLLQVLAVSASVIGIGAAANAQQSGPVDVAKYQYDAHCAACHGLQGKGDGVFAEQLQRGKAVPNLTELSKKNSGVFPFARVYETIDGRQQVQAHGTKDMPIWGERIYPVRFLQYLL